MKVCCMIVLLVVFYTSERPVKKTATHGRPWIF